MNLVGKIFTLLIFLMSIVFASFAIMINATHENWMASVMTPVTGLNARLLAEKKLNKELHEKQDALKEELKIEKERAVQVIAALEQQNQTLQSDRLANDKETARLEAIERDGMATVSATHKSIATLHGESEATRAKIVAAKTHREGQLAQAVELTEKTNGLATELLRLQKLSQDLAGQLQEALSLK